ncbi:hypothetical protein [Sciscionella marina]|uniref:hypothetical protein n=1 Tax=Sciscionella marina TaxID=508770 RepID=UPI0012F63B46|nr:hypothetical protein [Sciscionella marina]
MYEQTVMVRGELADHEWRKVGRTEGIEGFLVNRWRRGSVELTLAWVGDHEVSHAVVSIAGQGKRRIELDGLAGLITSHSSAERDLVLKRTTGFLHAVAWQVRNRRRARTYLRAVGA